MLKAVRPFKTLSFFLIEFHSQIDLGSRHKVTAIATQGRIGGFFVPTAWVTGYKVQSSDNGNAYSWATNIEVSGMFAFERE